MKRKLKFLFKIFLLIAVTMLCVLAGFKTREKKAIVVTQFGQTSKDSNSGYLLESETGRLTMIDGGTKEDAESVLNTIKQKGGFVEVWFITVPHKENAGVLLEALEDKDIQVGGIYLSLNNEDWYEKYETAEEKEFAMDFIETLEEDDVRDKVHELNFRDEINIDNLFFKVLKVKHPEYTENAGNNQSLVLKVSNNFKSMIFLGNLGEEYQEAFINDNQDEIKADALQVSYHGENTLNEKIYEFIKPTKYFWNTSEDVTHFDSEAENYFTKFGDITVEI